MNSDPIDDSPPKRRRLDDDSEGDSGDLHFYEGTATLLLPRFSPPADAITSPITPSPPRPHYTQTTQPIEATPQASNKISQILVPGTSPASAGTPVARAIVSASPPPTRRPLAIAPPGTIFRPPVFHRSNHPAQPNTKISSDSEEDPLVRDDSDHELGKSKSDIPPTIFRTGDTQVDEDPLARIRATTSQFRYQPTVPRKRPADDIVSAYANARRQTTRPARQTAPAKAIPVDSDDMDIEEEIPDFYARQKVRDLKTVFSQFPYRKLWHAFVSNKQNYNDALQWLGDQADNDEAKQEQQGNSAGTIDPTMSDNEIGVASARKPVPKPTVKRQLEKKTNKSLADKYNSVVRKKGDANNVPVEAQATQPKSRRRLKQGLRKRSPSVEPVSSRHSSPEPVITVDNDLEAEESADAGSDGSTLEDDLLKFINNCAEQEFMDIANCSKDNAQLILSNRPYRSLGAVRAVSNLEFSQATKSRKGSNRRRPLGDRLVDVCLEVMAGLEAVDRLVERCQVLGDKIEKDMTAWGIKPLQTTEELSIATLGDVSSDTSSKNDSGVGTPRNSPPAPSQAADRVDKHTRKFKAKFLQQPAVMSSDVTLKDYQLVGLNWLRLLWSKGISGILADEMGLGKTCQVISFLSHLLEIGVAGPHLIVCPSSTLENWIREFHRFSPSLVVEVYYGSKEERCSFVHAVRPEIHSVNVIVTTYEIARKKGADHVFLKNLGLKTAIFDEGHMLKNSNTERYRMLMDIRAEWRLLITGTPLQNNLQELVSVLAFLMPDLFLECRDDLLYIFKHKAKASDEDHAALLSKQRIARARSMMAPFVLRRRKEQVLTDLPAKHPRIEYCGMTPVQKEIYDEYADEHQRALEARAAGEPYDSESSLIRRRQAAIHPLLFRRHFDDSMLRKMARRIPKKGKFRGWSDIKAQEHFEWLSDFALHKLCYQYSEDIGGYDRLNNDEWMDSGKVQKLVEILKKHAANGDRTLLFSQFTSVLDILEAVLETVNISFSRIDGAVSVAERQDLIDQYHQDESIQVFMLSTKAGGTGINLACANKVIIFDSSFNPHDDIQAENRAHRIGQKREVEIIRLITRGTIEEQIHALGNSKLILDERVSGEGESSNDAYKMGQKIIEDMLLEKGKKDGTHVNNLEGSGGNAGSRELKDLFAKGLRDAGVEVFS